MANMLLGFPFYSDANATYTPTFSGGSWEADLPLTNLQDRRLARVARSADAALANTKFEIDLKAERGIRLFAVPKHNLSLAAKIKIRGSTVAGDFSSPVYDTGWLDVFPVIYPTGTLPVGHPSYTSRKLSQEDLDEGYNIGFVHVAAAPQVARYWLVEVDDTTNAAGYVDLARLALAGAYQPTVNMNYGVKLGWDTSSTRSESDGGAAIYAERPRRRVASFVLEHIPQDEAYVSPFGIMRSLGTTRQTFFVYDPEDTAHLHRRAFLGVLGELSPLDMPYFDLNAVGIKVIEEL